MRNGSTVMIPIRMLLALFARANAAGSESVSRGSRAPCYSFSDSGVRS